MFYLFKQKSIRMNVLHSTFQYTDRLSVDSDSLRYIREIKGDGLGGPRRKGQVNGCTSPGNQPLSDFIPGTLNGHDISL